MAYTTLYSSNAAAVTMSITYGIDIEDKEDRYIAMAERALEGVGQAASPGAFLVDLLPWRKLSSSLLLMWSIHMEFYHSQICPVRLFTITAYSSTYPYKHSEWVPGASFKRKAREWHAAVMQMKDAPFATVVHEMVRRYSRAISPFQN
jgi:hypothetical protein